MNKSTVELMVHTKGTHELIFRAKFFEGKTLEWYCSVNEGKKWILHNSEGKKDREVREYLDRVEVVTEEELLNLFVPKVDSPLRFLSL